MGRPTAFDEEKATKIVELFANGSTEAEVAEIIGVHENTIRNWKKSHQKFLWATKEAKEFADSLVEKSLFKRAIGMKYYEEAVTKDGVIAIQKYAPPDAQSMKYWLNNRKPKQWRDRVEMVHSVHEEEELALPDGTSIIDQS